MALEKKDLKNIETYTTALRREAAKIGASGTKFWAYKDIVMPTAKGPKGKVVLISFGKPDPAMKDLIKGKAVACAGTCRPNGPGLVFEATAGKVENDVLGKLLGKTVQVTAAKVQGVLPAGIRRAGTVGPPPPSVKEKYDEMTKRLAAMAKANRNALHEERTDDLMTALRDHIAQMRKLSSGFIALSSGHLDNPPVKKALEEFEKGLDDYAGHYTGADVTDALKEMQKGLAGLAAKLDYDPPAEIQPQKPLPSRVPHRAPAPTTDLEKVHALRVALMDIKRDFNDLQRMVAENSAHPTGSKYIGQHRAPKVKAIQKRCDEIMKIMPDAKTKRFATQVQTELEKVIDPTTNETAVLYRNAEKGIEGLRDAAVDAFPDHESTLKVF
jgi:hypothetical protein